MEGAAVCRLSKWRAQHVRRAQPCSGAQEAARNREIQARDLHTMTVLSSEVAPRPRSVSPASGGARTGAAAADRLRELGVAFDAVLAATGALTGAQGPDRHVGEPAV